MSINYSTVARQLQITNANYLSAMNHMTSLEYKINKGKLSIYDRNKLSSYEGGNSFPRCLLQEVTTNDTPNCFVIKLIVSWNTSEPSIPSLMGNETLQSTGIKTLKIDSENKQIHFMISNVDDFLSSFYAINKRFDSYGLKGGYYTLRYPSEEPKKDVWFYYNSEDITLCQSLSDVLPKGVIYTDADGIDLICQLDKAGLIDLPN